MVNMGTFTNLFGKSPRVVVVEAFAENPDEDLSVPEIVRISGVSKRAAYIHVRHLLDEGIIKKHRKSGKCWYYKFNENDPRGEALAYLDSALALGFLEQQIKRDEGISPDAPLSPFIQRKWDWKGIPTEDLSITSVGKIHPFQPSLPSEPSRKPFRFIDIDFEESPIDEVVIKGIEESESMAANQA